MTTGASLPISLLYSEETLARGGHRIKGDETFLTLYAFVSPPATLADDVTTTLWQCAWWPCMLSNT